MPRPVALGVWPEETGTSARACRNCFTELQVAGKAHNRQMGDLQKARLHTAQGVIDGEALLESAELIFRGPPRLRIPFKTVHTIETQDGRLTINGDVVLELGTAATRWAEKIRNPRTVVQKLGIKSGQSVALVRVHDQDFVAELKKSGATVSAGESQNLDALFYGASTRDDLGAIAQLKGSLARNGALWIIRPKGVQTITESDVLAAGRAAGLVDVKVVKFSESHTAEKFVIPVAKR